MYKKLAKVLANRLKEVVGKVDNSIPKCLSVRKTNS